MARRELAVSWSRIQGRTKAEVARDYRLYRQCVHELARRFDAEGEAGRARSPGPQSSR